MRKTARYFNWFLLKVVGILGSCMDISGEYVLVSAGSCVHPPKCEYLPTPCSASCPFSVLSMCSYFPLPAFFHRWRMFFCPLAFLSPYPSVLGSTVDYSHSCHLPFLVFLLSFTLLEVRLTQRNIFQSFNFTNLEYFHGDGKVCIPILKASLFLDFESLLQNTGLRGFAFFSKEKVTQWVTEFVTKACFLGDGRNCLGWKLPK